MSSRGALFSTEGLKPDPQACHHPSLQVTGRQPQQQTGPWASCSWDTLRMALVALARTDTWSQPPWEEKPHQPGLRTPKGPCRGPPHTPRSGPSWAGQLNGSASGGRTAGWPHTHPDAVVPALPLGLSGLHACAVTHRPPAQPMAALDFVGDDPDLEHRPGEAGPAAVGQLGWEWGGQGGSPETPAPATPFPTWSRGPTDTLRTLLDTCSQLEPCG